MDSCSLGVHRVLKKVYLEKKARANLQKGLTCWLKCIDFILKVVGSCLKVYLGFAVPFFLEAVVGYLEVFGK